MAFRLICGDRVEVMRTMPDSSIDAVVTDPPYGLGKEPDALAMLSDWLEDGHHEVTGGGFMGKKWDSFVPGPAVWRECLRVLKPGGYLLAFAGSRTQDLMGLSLRIAGFEIRDCIFWVYGSGFPKSLDVSKAIDKAAEVERTEVIGFRHRNVKPYDDGNGWNANNTTGCHEYTAPATDAAKQWQGWGTALKPAYEPIIVARKPLEGTVAANVLKWGTGAINVDGCRVPTSDTYSYPNGPGGKSHHYSSDKRSSEVRPNPTENSPLGRFPANIIHDGSDEVLGLFPASNENSAARFFYCAKASKADRGAGNNHPTVKPTGLMRYLCRMVTPPGGTVLDPHTGSGSTGKAAVLEGFGFVGVELEADSVSIAQSRISEAEKMVEIANAKKESANHVCQPTLFND